MKNEDCVFILICIALAYILAHVLGQPEWRGACFTVMWYIGIQLACNAYDKWEQHKLSQRENPG